MTDRGYYDLYATNAESPLLRPWPKAEMPFISSQLIVKQVGLKEMERTARVKKERTFD